jgi:hypothetical protein
LINPHDKLDNYLDIHRNVRKESRLELLFATANLNAQSPPHRQMNAQLQQIIDMVRNGHFRTQCPNCKTEVQLDRARIYTSENAPVQGQRSGTASDLSHQPDRPVESESQPHALIQRTLPTQRINRGLILERIAPIMHGFQYDKSDCRALFDPIDYVVFDGLSALGIVRKIVFLEIKTGTSNVNPRQSMIAKRIAEKKVEFITYDNGRDHVS